MEKRKLGAVMMLTLSSQIISALASFSLPILGKSFADLYAIANQVGVIGFGGVILGVVYNLAIGRVNFSKWGLWAGVGVMVSLVATVIQLTLLEQGSFFDRLPSPPVGVGSIISFGLGGALLCIGGVIGVRRACLGRPSYFATMTLLPNFGTLAGVGVASSTNIYLAPAIGWLMGCAFIALLGLFLPALPQVEVGVEPRAETIILHTIGLSLGVLASSFMPMFYATALVTLPAGTTYWATLMTRIGTAAVTLFVNSYLLVKYRWGRIASDQAGRAITLGGFFVVANTMGFWLSNQPGAYVVGLATMVTGFFAALVASALTIRQLNARRLGSLILGKSAVDLILAIFATVLLFKQPSFTGYIAAFGVSQAFTLVAGGVGFRNKNLIIVGSLSLLSTFAVLLLGR